VATGRAVSGVPLKRWLSPSLGVGAYDALVRIVEEEASEPSMVFLAAGLVVRESCGAALRASQNG
jgi:hypothetical protein